MRKERATAKRPVSHGKQVEGGSNGWTNPSRVPRRRTLNRKPQPVLTDCRAGGLGTEPADAFPGSVNDGYLRTVRAAFGRPSTKIVMVAVSRRGPEVGPHCPADSDHDRKCSLVVTASICCVCRASGAGVGRDAGTFTASETVTIRRVGKKRPGRNESVARRRAAGPSWARERSREENRGRIVAFSQLGAKCRDSELRTQTRQDQIERISEVLLSLFCLSK